MFGHVILHEYVFPLPCAVGLIPGFDNYFLLTWGNCLLFIIYSYIRLGG